MTEDGKHDFWCEYPTEPVEDCKGTPDKPGCYWGGVLFRRRRLAALGPSRGYQSRQLELQGWEAWLKHYFPKPFSRPFTEYQKEFWDWGWAIEPETYYRPRVECQPRGVGKSTSAETWVVSMLARQKKKSIGYVSGTDDKATLHFNSIRRKLENPELLKAYPHLKPRVQKYRNAFNSWSQDRLVTEGGQTLIPITLKGSNRGFKSEDDTRFDLICHEIGTPVCDSGEWMAVEDHETATLRNSDGIEVRLWGVPFSEVVTPEHRYWVREYLPNPKHKILRVQGSDGWVEAKDLHEHCFIGLPVDNSTTLPQPITRYAGNIEGQRGGGAQYKDVVPVEFSDPEWWWLFGLWWGDGHVAGRYQIGITIADTQPEIQQRVETLLARYSIKWTVVPKDGCVQLVFSHAAFNRWLRTWKHGNAMKRPPQWVETLEKRLQFHLLRGYLDADGWVNSKANEIKLTSVYLDGLLSMRRMLARFGIAASIRKGAEGVNGYVIKGISCNTRRKYDLRFQDNALELGYDIPNQTRYAFTRTFVRDGYLWSKVRECSPVEDRIFVPITTKTHDYLTHFGRSHNCLDDIDSLGESPDVVAKNLELLKSEIIFAGYANTTILFAQNLIYRDSICSQVMDYRADILTDRDFKGPYPLMKWYDAVKIDLPDGGKQWKIMAGEVFDKAIPLEYCEAVLNQIGKDLFDREAQQDVTKVGEDKDFREWNEIYHVITRSEMVKGFERVELQDANGFFIPHRWHVGRGMDWGTTRQHPTAVAFVTRPDKTCPHDDSHFVFAEVVLPVFPYDPSVAADLVSPGRVAAKVKETEQKFRLRKEQIVESKMSHEASAARNTLIVDLPDSLKTFFQKWKAQKGSGVPQIQNLLEVDKTKPHPFRKYPKGHAEEGQPLMGRPRIYFIVEDGQGELYVDDTGKLRVTGARDSSGLARTRYEMPLYNHRNEGKKKIDDDFVDGFRGLMATFGVQPGALTTDEKIEKALPAALKTPIIAAETDPDRLYKLRQAQMIKRRQVARQIMKRPTRSPLLKYDDAMRGR